MRFLLLLLTTLTLNDPKFPEQSNLGPNGIDATSAWSLTQGEGGIVCILDSGADWYHEELRAQYYLNPGEFPAWVTAGSDGVLSIEDFTVATTDVAGNNFILDPTALTVADLLRHFSDGIDNDGNGYVDDLSGWDFDDDDNDPFDLWYNGHGPGRAGILAAAANNGLGGIGIAPRARILAIRLGDAILHTTDTLAQAAAYCADMGADSINMSLGSSGLSTFMLNAFAYARSRDVVNAAASGNESHYHHEFPAIMDGVLATGSVIEALSEVGAWTEKNNTTVYGPKLALAAPTKVWTVDPFGTGQGSRREGGTSSATPHVAGSALLVKTAARKLGFSLSEAEVTQILRATATDITGTKWGAQPGWDPFTGYGRVNAGAAVAAVAQSRIPPTADILAPRWFKVFPRTASPIDIEARFGSRSNTTLHYRLDWSPGMPPTTWQTITEGESTGFQGRLARVEAIQLQPAPSRPPLEDARNPQNHTVTFRLTVWDPTTGIMAEDRQTVFVIEDRSLRHGFPIDNTASIESSLLAADLDGDGTDELVYADSDGSITAIDGNGSIRWRIQTSILPVHTAQAAYRTGGLKPTGEPVLGALAAGDLDGDGQLEIVVPGLLGHIYTFRSDGRLFWPAPATTDLSRYPGERRTRARLYSTPVLIDLDRDGTLEIVAGAQDQQLYAWHGDGKRVAGFPVFLSNRHTLDDVIAGRYRPAPVHGPPAVGDLDGDGLPDIIVGTNEIDRNFVGYIYAVDARGMYAPRGPFKAGWPVSTLVAPFGLPVIGEGVSGAPTLVDLDGDGTPEVIGGGFSGIGGVWDARGRLLFQIERNRFAFGAYSNADEPLVAAWTNSVPVVGDIDNDGHPEILAATIGLGGLAASTVSEDLAGGLIPMPNHLLAVWKADGSFAPAYPRRLEGWAMLTNPLLVDVDGDDRPEIVAGSSGFYLHAFRMDGSEPEGWPKFTGGWLLATPAAAAFTNSKTTLVTATREGQILAWDTPASIRSALYGQHRANPERTGLMAAPVNATPTEEVAGCACQLGRRAGGDALLLSLALVWLAWRRWRVRL